MCSRKMTSFLVSGAIIRSLSYAIQDKVSPQTILDYKRSVAFASENLYDRPISKVAAAYSWAAKLFET